MEQNTSYAILSEIFNICKNSIMTKEHVWSAISAIATVATSLITLIVVTISFFSTKAALKQTKILSENNNSAKTARIVDIHSKFSAEVRSIQRRFTAQINLPQWKPSQEDTRTIQLYWYVVFDEWLICTQLDHSLDILWKTLYSKGVGSALENDYFAQTIADMFNSKIKFCGYREKFLGDINRICVATRKCDISRFISTLP